MEWNTRRVQFNSRSGTQGVFSSV